MIWIRRTVMTVIRRYMQPIPPDIARTWHKRLTIAYLFFAFNTFVCTVYMVNQYNPKRKRLQQGDRAHNIAKDFGFINPTIVRISPAGITTEKYTVPHDFEEK